MRFLSLRRDFFVLTALGSLFFAIVLAAPSQAQQVVYVDADATGGGDGSSWADAFTSLQDARDRAISEDIGEIWVAEGTYYPDQGASVSSGDRTETFQLTDGIAIYGGFAGNESNRSERAPEENETILSGDIGLSDDDSDNTYHVVTGSNTDTTAVLAGVTVTKGNADGSGSQRHGGGIYIDGGSPTVLNVDVISNTAQRNGGGMYNVDGSKPTIQGGVFRNNTARWGGGMYNQGSSPSLLEVNFVENSVSDRGGGIYNYEGSNPSIRQSRFIGNTSGEGGAGINNYQNSAPKIDRCYFAGNEAGNDGGAINNDANATVITNTVFSGNTAENGGAIKGSPKTILNSTFSGNTADKRGGAIYIWKDRDPRIENTIFSGNSAPRGDEIGGNLEGSPYVAYSLVQGKLPDGVQEGGNNVIGSPRFADHDGPDDQVGTEDDDLRLEEGTLGIDMGSNQALDLDSDGDATDDIPEDFSGNDRIYNGDGEGEAVVDLGAYERQSAPASPPTYEGVVYVDASAQDGNEGTSWGDALNALKLAREKAIVHDVEEIWIAEGTYYPDRGASHVRGDRSASFRLSSGIGIYGGFAGNESNRSERDPEANETVLSGDISNPGFTDDNSYHVVTSRNTDTTAVLAGVTVTKGNANGKDSRRFGGGMFIDSGTPTVQNVIFTDNIARVGGGGMINVDGSAPVILGAEFRNNTGTFGGGMHNQDSSPLVRNVIFANNSAPHLNCGFFCEYNGNGGAMYNKNGSSPIIKNTYFLRNTSDDWGGAMFNINNSAPTISRCFFAGNEAGDGGGGISNQANATVIKNSIFSGNSASKGGGGLRGSPKTIINTTFSGNTVDNGAGGVHLWADRDPLIYNVILSNNSGSEIGGDLGGDAFVAYSLIEENLPDGVEDGGNNVIGNPLFKDDDGPDGQIGTKDDNLRLKEGSLGIDMGSNQALDLDNDGDTDDDLPKDFAGKSRIYDGDEDGNSVVDMGAYERRPFAPPSNLAASVSGSEVELTWDESDRTGITGYNVYRSTSSFSDVASATKLNSDPIESPGYTDTGVQIGQTYYYRVTVVAGDGEESGPSNEARVTLESAEYFAWPVDEPQVSQDYGTYNSGFADRFHLGIDLISANGSRDIYAAAAGDVILEGSVSEGTGDDAYGTYVVVDHGNNLYALYAHLASKEDVQSVGQGERIGTMGESGDVDGRHLHFDVMARPSEPSEVEDFDNGYHTDHPSKLGHPDPKTYLKHRVVRVTSPTLNVRRGPDSSAALVEGGTTVSQGQEFVSVGPPVGGWYFIYLPYDVIPSTDDSYFDYDRYGWVHGQYLDVEVSGRTQIRVDGRKIAAAEGPAKHLNVRSSPNVSSNALTKVWGGQRFVKIGAPVNGPGSDEPWYQIHLPEKAGATEGWVSGDFLEVTNADASSALVAVAKNVSSDGVVDFGSTGVDVIFSGVGGSGDVEVKKFGNPPIGESGFVKSKVSNYRFTIEADSGLSFGSSTEIRLDVSTLAGVGDANQVTLYRRPAEGQGIFKPLSTQYDAENSELVATTGSFSEFVLASNTEPLPVELARFEGSVEGEKVLLKWRTASETNNSGFYVQRRAAGTDSWTRLTFVKGKGTTSSPQTYRYRDTDPPYAADSLTYRLKQVDTDGSTSLSEPITVRRGTPEEVKLLGSYPNPARSHATVRFAVPTRQEVRVSLYDVLGRKVKTVVDGEKKGRQQARLDVSDLSSGTYFLRLKAEGQVKTQRLTVVR